MNVRGPAECLGKRLIEGSMLFRSLLFTSLAGLVSGEAAAACRVASVPNFEEDITYERPVTADPGDACSLRHNFTGGLIRLEVLKATPGLSPTIEGSDIKFRVPPRLPAEIIYRVTFQGRLSNRIYVRNIRSAVTQN